jgi:hypothetical protein
MLAHRVAKSPPFARLIPLAVTLIALTPARASDVDSEHLFGFTEGADIGEAGEREAETETIGRFGRAEGTYARSHKMIQ